MDYRTAITLLVWVAGAIAAYGLFEWRGAAFVGIIGAVGLAFDWWQRRDERGGPLP